MIKMCPYADYDGGEMSYVSCTVLDYGYWFDSSVHWDRPKACPYRHCTVSCDMWYTWAVWEAGAPGMKRPQKRYDTEAKN